MQEQGKTVRRKKRMPGILEKIGGAVEKQAQSGCAHGGYTIVALLAFTKNSGCQEEH